MAIAIAIDVAFRTSATSALALVVKNFRAGAARAGFAHHPEIAFFTHADDAVFRHFHFFVPDFERLVIVLINRHPEFLLGQFDYVNQIFPCPGDGFFLEIITERKIAEHFEKGMMTRRDADIFQIVMLAAGARAFLAGNRPCVAAVFQA